MGMREVVVVGCLMSNGAFLRSGGTADAPASWRRNAHLPVATCHLGF